MTDLPAKVEAAWCRGGATHDWRLKMTDTKHTPGPWRVVFLSPEESQMGERGEWNISAPSEDFLFGNSPYYPYVSRNIADAHLIAAAPELLEALENLTIAVDMSWDMDGVLEASRAVIAKARGDVK